MKDLTAAESPTISDTADHEGGLHSTPPGAGQVESAQSTSPKETSALHSPLAKPKPEGRIFLNSQPTTPDPEPSPIHDPHEAAQRVHDIIDTLETRPIRPHEEAEFARLLAATATAGAESTPKRTSQNHLPFSHFLIVEARGIKGQVGGYIANLIDRVHDFKVPEFRAALTSDDPPPGYLGDFGLDAIRGLPPGWHGNVRVPITLRFPQPFPFFTACHEYAHFISHLGISRNRTSAAESAPFLQTWRDAIDEDPTTIELQERLRFIYGQINTIARSSGVSPQKMRAIEEARDSISYVLRREEVFARSYAQYIMRRTGDPILKAEYKKQLLLKSQAVWTAADFAPIESALDEAFTKLGWR